MLRMNKLADYGTVVMVYLARMPEEQASARDIAEQTRLSPPTVSKVLKRLTAAKLLLSLRGTKGGYRLKQPADAISITDILYALDETRGLTACSFEPEACALHQVCHVEENWRLISHAIESALQSVSLAELAKPVMSAAKLNQIKRVVMGVGRVESA